MKTHRLLATALSTIAGLGLLACGGSADSIPSSSSTQVAPPALASSSPRLTPADQGGGEALATSSEYGLFDFLRARYDALSTDTAYRTVLEALPNVVFTFRDGSTASATDLAVVGSFERLQPLDGFKDDGSLDGRLVPFDDAEALWRSVLVTLSVDDVLALSSQDFAVEDTVEFILLADADLTLERVAEELSAAGKSLVLLRQSPGFYPGAPNAFFLAGQGTLWLPIGEDGSLTAPALPPEAIERLEITSTSIADVRRASTNEKTLAPAWERERAQPSGD